MCVYAARCADTIYRLFSATVIILAVYRLSGLRLMKLLSFSASSRTCSVVGMSSGLPALACRISLASWMSSNLISYGVLLDIMVSKSVCWYYLSDFGIMLHFVRCCINYIPYLERVASKF